jgi:putative endonuclease
LNGDAVARLGIDPTWVNRGGPIDGGLLAAVMHACFICEVRSRATARFGTPGESVTHEKRQRVRHLAASWIDQSEPRPATIRFDVAGVLGAELTILEGAF